MPHHFERLEPNEIGLSFKTNDEIDVEALSNFFRELAREARRHLGPDVVLRIAEIGTGSLWTRITIIGGVIVGLATVGDFGLNLAEALYRPRNKLAQAVAAIILDSGVVEAKIVTHDRTIVVHRNEMPSVPLLEARRRAKPLPPPVDQSPIIPSDPSDRRLAQPFASPFARPFIPSSGPEPKTSKFETQRVGRGPPRDGGRLTLIGRFYLAPDGTGTFSDLAGNQFRVHNPGVDLEPVPLGEIRVAECIVFGGDDHVERAIAVYKTSPIPDE
jgi:hypothetical protein